MVDITNWTYCIKGVPGSFPPAKKKVRVLCSRWSPTYRPCAVRISPKKMIAYVGLNEVEIDIKEVVAWQRADS